MKAILTHKFYHSYPDAPGQVAVNRLDALFHTYEFQAANKSDFTHFAKSLSFEAWDFYPKSGALWLRGTSEDWRFLLRP